MSSTTSKYSTGSLPNKRSQPMKAARGGPPQKPRRVNPKPRRVNPKPRRINPNPIQGRCFVPIDANGLIGVHRNRHMQQSYFPFPRPLYEQLMTTPNMYVCGPVYDNGPTVPSDYQVVVSGKMLVGEDARTSMVREAHEEIGLIFPPFFLQNVNTTGNHTHGIIDAEDVMLARDAEPLAAGQVRPADDFTRRSHVAIVGTIQELRAVYRVGERIVFPPHDREANIIGVAIVRISDIVPP